MLREFEPEPWPVSLVPARGGEPGFVRIDVAGTLTIPDYSGNRFFNTLGNLLVNPRAGLLFIDFAKGDLLQMTGHMELPRRRDQGVGEVRNRKIAVTQ